MNLVFHLPVPRCCLMGDISGQQWRLWHCIKMGKSHWRLLGVPMCPPPHTHTPSHLPDIRYRASMLHVLSITTVGYVAHVTHQSTYLQITCFRKKVDQQNLPTLPQLQNTLRVKAQDMINSHPECNPHKNPVSVRSYQPAILPG